MAALAFSIGEDDESRGPTPPSNPLQGYGAGSSLGGATQALPGTYSGLQLGGASPLGSLNDAQSSLAQLESGISNATSGASISAAAPLSNLLASGGGAEGLTALTENVGSVLNGSSGLTTSLNGGLNADSILSGQNVADLLSGTDSSLFSGLTTGASLTAPLGNAVSSLPSSESPLGSLSTGASTSAVTGSVGAGTTPGVNAAFGLVGGISNLFGGLQEGGALGDFEAALGAGRLGELAASEAGVLSGSSLSAVKGGLGDLTDILGLIQGIEQGGIAGDTGAAISGLQLAAAGVGQATQAGLLSADSLLSEAGADVTEYLPIIGDALALYNYSQSYQSAATGADTLSGAETGASIGTSIEPGFGTVIGAIIGAIVGAGMSAFGGGEPDPETEAMQAYTTAYNQNPAIASGETSADAFQFLAGVFDAKNNSPGHSTPLEQIWGREGEGAFVTSMMNEINSAVRSGRVAADASPTTIFNDVVQPWLENMIGAFGGGATNAEIEPTWTDVQGQPFGSALDSSIENLIAAYEGGSLTNQTPVGISGQTLQNLAPVATGLTPTPNSGAASITVSNPTQIKPTTSTTAPSTVGGSAITPPAPQTTDEATLLGNLLQTSTSTSEL